MVGWGPAGLGAGVVRVPAPRCFLRAACLPPRLSRALSMELLPAPAPDETPSASPLVTTPPLALPFRGSRPRPRSATARTSGLTSHPRPRGRRCRRRWRFRPLMPPPATWLGARVVTRAASAGMRNPMASRSCGSHRRGEAEMSFHRVNPAWREGVD
jgi:hypothetical protein